MGIRKISIEAGEYYHFYNRGNSKQNIFLDEQDYDRFTKLLFLCNSNKNINFKTDIVEKEIDAWDFKRGEPLVSICAWVLMPNHFHLYIKTPDKSETFPEARLRENTRIANVATLFMLKSSTAYAKYFNTKYERTGSLFEGKFKSVYVANDVQARYLFSYIHLNPIKLIQSNWREQGIIDKQAMFEYAKNYKYSSFSDWLGPDRKELAILDKKDLINILPENFSPRDDIFEWLDQSGQDDFS